MAIKLDREIAGDIHKPALDVIAWCISQHRKEYDRLEMLSNYYDGKHQIVNRDKQADEQLTNVIINNAKYVTDMNVGFTVGNPISYSDSESDIQPILDLFDRIRVRRHDRELEKDLSVFGIGYELHYLSEKDDEVVPNITCIDPRGIFLVTDDTVDANKLFAVRYLQKYNLQGKDGWQVEVYTKWHKFVYRTQSLDMSSSELKSVKEHYYGDVPVVEFRNNEEKQGDFEQALSLIDAYNILQSDRLNDKEAFIDAILVLYGFSLEKEMDESYSPEKAEISGDKSNGKLIEAPAKTDGTDVQWLTKTFDESQVDILSKSIEGNIHKVTYTPNLNDEHFAGNISGEAMKYKLFGMLQLLVTKIGYLEDGLDQRLRLVANILNVKGKNIDVSNVKISFKPNLPINLSDVIQQIRDSQEFVPLLISLGWLPDVDNPEEVVNMLFEQKLQEMELQQRAMGLKDVSHTDKDDEPESDEEE